MRDWRNALYMSFTLNKIAIPYNRKVNLKAVFSAMKRVSTVRRNATRFFRHSLLFRAMQALTLHQVTRAKVKTMREKVEANRLGRVFDAFIDQLLVQ